MNEHNGFSNPIIIVVVVRKINQDIYRINDIFSQFPAVIRIISINAFIIIGIVRLGTCCRNPPQSARQCSM